MKRKSAPAALLLGILLAGASLAACSSSTQTAGGSAPAHANGDITIAGSTAMLPLVKDASAVYQDRHKDVKISVSGGGSATGIAQVAGHAIDIGDSDIAAPDQPQLHDNRVAVVGFAIGTNPSTGVKNLSKQQLQDIFAGKVTNWKQVGGPDQKIVVINRPRSSGTRAVFTKTIMGDVPITDGGLVQDATGTVASVVKQTPGAITYLALSGVTGGIAVLSVGGVAPTVANITSGTYPIWSYEHMFTIGPPKGNVADFIGFVQHQTDLVQKNKFIPVNAMKVSEKDR